MLARVYHLHELFQLRLSGLNGRILAQEEVSEPKILNLLAENSQILKVITMTVIIIVTKLKDWQEREIPPDEERLRNMKVRR